MNFEYKTEYTSETSVKPIAELIITGEILFLDVNRHDSIIKGWKKDKKLPDDVNLEIVNSVLRKCVVRALTLSEELQLPPPIALPYASKKDSEENSSKYIG